MYFFLLSWSKIVHQYVILKGSQNEETGLLDDDQFV